MLDGINEDNLRITVRRVDPDIVLVSIAEELDMETAPKAKELLTNIQAVSPRHLILDLRDVTFLSSSGLALLIEQSDETTNAQLHLLGVIENPAVERPLAAIGMIEDFDIATDLDTLLTRLHATKPLTD